jgi:hypothetical protein
MSPLKFHVTKGMAERLVSGSLSKRLAKKSIRHLLGGCGKCMDMIRSVVTPHPNEDYSGPLRRVALGFVVAKGQIDEERIYAQRLWPDLEKQPPELRLFMVKHLPEFRTWGIYSIALQRVKEISRNDPLQAVDFAHLAVTIAETLDVEFYGEERRSDFVGAAYTTVGNSKRLASDFNGAASALVEAEKWLEKGSGDLLERANLISIRSSLASDLGNIEDAMEMLFPAIRLARRMGDEHFEGKLVLKQSSTIGFVDPLTALELANRGLRLLEGGGDTHLELTGRYLTAYWTNEIGDSWGAKAKLELCRPQIRRFGDVFWTGRLMNLEGRIARAEGNLSQSELFFRQLVDLYAKADFEFDLALASLDLSAVLTRQGKIEESTRILQDLYPILKTWHLNGDILRSWLILQEGLRLRTMQEEAFRELEMLLRRKWHRKSRPFAAVHPGQ